jgi:serine/threonine protein kinase
MKIGKYEIQDELGRGSMGVVFRAWDPLLDRHVAIKVISTESLDDWTKTMFEREAKAVARMSHPNIIVVYDFDYVEKQPYIVMELLKGANLDDLALEQQMALPKVLDIIFQTLNGLQHAHEQGVIHRDVKPTNIFITDSGVVKIMDFGVARLAASSSTATQGFVLGTPEFMSPEQVKAETLDGRTDVFSVGTMLYWLFTGETPFAAETAHTTMFKVVNEEPPPLHVKGVNHKIQSALQTILNRALAKEPVDRFASAGEMAKDLKDLILLLEEKPELANEDDVFENAETVQVPIPRFSTVKKTQQMPSPKPAFAESPAKEPGPIVAESKNQDSSSSTKSAAGPTIIQRQTEPEPLEIERTMQLGSKIPDLSFPPPPPQQESSRPRISIDVPPAKPIRRFSAKNIVIAAILLLAAGWGIYRVIVAPKIPPHTHLIPPLVPQQINVAVSEEKVLWSRHFSELFAKTPAGKNVRLSIVPEMPPFYSNELFSQGKHYQIWWPSSELEARLCNADQQKTLSSTHKSIVLTPMVFVMWKDRYDAFISRYRTVNFATIARALKEESGWTAISGKPEWGRFTFGFPDPEKTNSGAVLLLLMTHEYLKKSSALNMVDIQNAGLQKFLSGIKQHGTILSSSANGVMEEILRKGPSSYNIAFVYENLAIESVKDARNRWGDYHVAYPIYNYWNENPMYLLNSPWVSTEQQKVSAAFEQFLSGDAAQKDALEHGFRPVLTSVPLQAPGSPFVEYKELGVRSDVGSVIENSDIQVVRALLERWKKL